jgi:hypothetical protein
VNAISDSNKLTKTLTLHKLQCIDVSAFLHLIRKFEHNVKHYCFITVVSCTMINPNPKSDGFGDENPNPTDTDFLYIRHIPFSIPN